MARPPSKMFVVEAMYWDLVRRPFGWIKQFGFMEESGVTAHASRGVQDAY